MERLYLQHGVSEHAWPGLRLLVKPPDADGDTVGENEKARDLVVTGLFSLLLCNPSQAAQPLRPQLPGTFPADAEPGSDVSQGCPVYVDGRHHCG